MNAIEFLLKEHDKVRKSFAEISEPSHRFETKRKMFDELCDMLTSHEAMEKKLWYPHFKNDEKSKELINHLISEENTAEETIKEFKKIKTQEEWEQKFLKIKKDVEHHASEEEQRLFPKVDQILDDEELNNIGKKMNEYRKESDNS